MIFEIEMTPIKPETGYSVNEPSVAILMGVRNGDKHLEAQLDSIATQSHYNWRLFVSDDGSTDNTPSILNEYKSIWPEGRLVILKGPRKGFACNFSSMIMSSDIRADYYACCDQDDVWKTEKITHGLGHIIGHGASGAILYGSRTQLVDEDGQALGYSPLFTRQPSFRNALVQSIAGGNTMIFNQKAKDILSRASADIQIISHDWWAYQVISACGGTVIYDPCPTILYRQHDGNLIGSNSGIAARLERVKFLFAGRFKEWNTVNLRALENHLPYFTPENLLVLEQFRQARQSPTLQRLSKMRHSGVYRQSNLDNVALMIAAIIGKI